MQELTHQNQKLGILHVVDFFDSRLGYAEFYLAKQQAQDHHKVSIITSDQSAYGSQRWIPGLATIDGVDILRLKSTIRIRGNAWGFNPSALLTTIKNLSPDVVHCHGLFSPLSQTVLLSKRNRQFSVVGDFMTGIAEKEELISRIGQIFVTEMTNSFLKHWFMNKVDAFFANNEAVQNWLHLSLGLNSSKIHFIPLGADKDLFQPDKHKRKETRSRMEISQEDIVAIYTGKLLPIKRIHDLLMASKSVIDKHANFKVLLVGDGPAVYLSRLKSLTSRLKIQNNVIVLKTVHRTKLSDFYNVADFAVWPGGFSISILEAMACGLPVIIAKSDWTGHYIENGNGFSFRAGDLSHLSSLILLLVNESGTRESMGKASRRLIDEKLNWDQIAAQYLEVYQHVLGIRPDSSD